MYASFYNLQTKPFSPLPDPDFLYLGPKHKMALSLLEYGLLNQAGLITVTGGPGTGKTTLLQRILEQSKNEFTAGIIFNTHEALGALIPRILMAFGQPTVGQDGKGLDRIESFRQFSEFLAKEEAQGRRVLLVIDEAHNLGPARLEELRLLSNNNGKTQAIQIILVGQPGLRDALKSPDLAQFAQHISMDYTLEPLPEEDTIAYIRHRIQVAGGTHPVFTQHACRLIFRLTGGTPRFINQVADMALAYGYAEKQKWVTANLVSQAVHDRGKAGNVFQLVSNWDVLSHTPQQDIEEQKEIASFETRESRSSTTASSHDHNDTAIHGAERYERGLALKKAGLYKPAIEQFEYATADPDLALKAYAQIGLCYKSVGRNENAVTAFRKALKASAGSPKETVQILYVLGRTLESLGRVAETLEAYRWIRREDPGYRDVASRIEQLSSRRPVSPGKRHIPTDSSWVGGVLKSWQDLLRNQK